MIKWIKKKWLKAKNYNKLYKTFIWNILNIINTILGIHLIRVIGKIKVQTPVIKETTFIRINTTTVKVAFVQKIVN